MDNSSNISIAMLGQALTSNERGGLFLVCLVSSFLLLLLIFCLVTGLVLNINHWLILSTTIAIAVWAYFWSFAIKYFLASTPETLELLTVSFLTRAIIVTALVVGLSLFVVLTVKDYQEQNEAEKKAAAQDQKSTVASGNEDKVVQARTVLVNVPYGHDKNGNEIYSEPILVSDGRFAYGFATGDPGTGCYKVKVNGVERGTSCPSQRPVDLGAVDGHGKKIKLQFHGDDRIMKLVVMTNF